MIRDEFKERWGRFTRRAARQIARIVLDPVADACGLQHFEIKVCALFKPLRLKQFALADELIEADPQLFLDAQNGLAHRGFGGHVVRVGVDPDMFHRVGFLARQGVEFRDAFQFLTKEGQPPGAIIQVRGKDFEGIAAYPETAPEKRRVVALVLLGDQIGDHLPLVIAFADFDVLGHGPVSFDRPDAVDARHRRHDDYVVAFQQRPRGGVAHAVDLFVNLALFLNISVGAGHIGFGLVIIVIADEIFDGVVWEEPLEFAV
mmetsp:Transcript_29475/g.57756  ORF Transcript_29475/g.57756 Transcript_29475/m.57756 type:complete len:260 (-) Transcript_29475:292-1071(-)